MGFVAEKKPAPPPERKRSSQTPEAESASVERAGGSRETQDFGGKGLVEGSDDALIRQWILGQNREAAFRSLFDRYHDPTFRLLRRRGFSIEESQDLVQEAFLKVHQNLSRYRPQEKFISWVFTIAQNAGKNLRRRQGASKRPTEALHAEGVDLEALASPNPGAFTPGASPALEELLRKERCDLVREAVTHLPPRMRHCVTLRIEHEMIYRDIAEILQVSESSVKVQLFKARKKLRDTLGSHFGTLDL